MYASLTWVRDEPEVWQFLHMHTVAHGIGS